jgi:hypothetical protein
MHEREFVGRRLDLAGLERAQFAVPEATPLKAGVHLVDTRTDGP